MIADCSTVVWNVIGLAALILAVAGVAIYSIAYQVGRQEGRKERDEEVAERAANFNRRKVWGQ